MNIELRPCTPEDLEQLRELSLKTYDDTFAPFNEPSDMEAYLKEAFDEAKLAGELQNPASEFFFLYVDGKPAGYLKLNEAAAQTEMQDEKALEIERIYVLSSFQGLGLGQYLMDQAIEMAQNRQKEYVWLGVWEKNAKALHFYEKNGFYTIGSHSFVMGEDDQTDYLMRRDLV